MLSVATTAALETEIEHWNETLPPFKEFVLSGPNPCHIAPDCVERAEGPGAAAQ